MLITRAYLPPSLPPSLLQGESVLAVTDDNVLSLTPKDILGGGGEGEREEGREIDVAVVEEGEKK